MLQETKAKRKNKVKLNNYVLFEQIRSNSAGGGLLTAVHHSLKPVCISNYEDSDEIMTVEATLKGAKVRLINGYGPQESSADDIRKSFFNSLDLEVQRAKLAGTMVFIEMDSNAKLGNAFISGDPKPQSSNGKLLADVIKKNDLIVVNGTEQCEGLITRFRKTVNSCEESVLDHVIVCRDMYQLLDKMLIDEAGAFALTKFSSKTGNSSCAQQSDHRTIVAAFDVKWNAQSNIQPRTEIYNYKNQASFDHFITLTNNNELMEKCFDNPEEDLEATSKRWLKLLKDTIKLSFKKIRIRNSNKNPKLDPLFQEKERLMLKLNTSITTLEADLIKEELENIEAKIAAVCSEKNKNLTDEYLGLYDDTFEGFSQARTWSLVKKLAPKNTIEPPAAKKTNSEILLQTERHLKCFILTPTLSV